MSDSGVFNDRHAQATAYLDNLPVGMIFGYSWDIGGSGTLTLLVPLGTKDEDFDSELFGYKVNLLRRSEPVPQ